MMYDQALSLDFLDTDVSNVEDVARSLLALNKLARRVPHFLENTIDGLQIQHLSLHVHEIKTGSLLEDIIVKYISEKQADLEEYLWEKLPEDTRSKIINATPLILSALILTGGLYANNWLTPDTPTTNITNNINTNIDNLSVTINVSPDKIREILDTTKASPDELAKESVDFIAPAKKSDGGRLLINKEIEIPSSAVREIPRPEYVHDAELPSRKIPHDDVIIEIRATDLDREKWGWYGANPEISDKRFRISISPTIDRESLHHADHIKANILVEYKIHPNGDEKLYVVHLLDVSDYID